VDKVLVVDDDEQARKAIQKSLERAVLEVQLADGLDSARAALAANRFDAVVLDMVMPNSGGDDYKAGLVVLAAIETQCCPRPAVVILTQLDSAQSALETLEHGSDAYLVKGGSVVARKLPDVLRKVLRQRRNLLPDPEVAYRVKRARELQKTGLPEDLVDHTADPRLTIAGRNLPAIWVSGDTYDFIPLADGSEIAFMLCDVSGKGPNAALVSMHLRVVFRLGVQNGWSLTAIDRAMHDSLKPFEDQEMYATGILGVLHISSRWIELLVAGHHSPSIVASRGAKRHLFSRQRGSPWGMPAERPHLDGFSFGPGQSVLFSSDGLLDIRSSHGKPFAMRRVHEAHRHSCHRDAVWTCEQVFYEAIKFADRIAAREDDLTILVIHWASRKR